MSDLCRCVTCREKRGISPAHDGWLKYFRYACELCGNKRCPHHQNHEFKCTNSNEPDQIGVKQ